MRRLCAAAVLVGCAILCACPTPPPPDDKPCGVPFWGDRSATPSIEIGQLSPEGKFVELHDGDPVDLQFPTQGGFVIYIVARVHNMIGCRAKTTATLRDPTGVNGVTFEARNIDYVIAEGDGGIPDVSETANTANVPVCPDFDGRDYVDQDYRLEVSVADLLDAGARTATAAITVRPECRMTGPNLLAACRCQCAANYCFGKCAADAGPDYCDAGHKDGG